METLKEFFNPSFIWFFIGLALFLLELAGPGLIMFFFGIGAWIVAAICFISPLSINFQLFLFLFVSLLSLSIFRRHLKEVFKGHVKAKQDLSKNFDDFIGENAIVKKAISQKKSGKVEFHGSSWNAEADEDIEAGTNVIIISKENLTFKVKRI